MSYKRFLYTGVMACSLAFTGQVFAQQPDNTKANKNDTATTADQQKNNVSDRELTQKIRKAVMADKTLSTTLTTSRSSRKTAPSPSRDR